MGDPLLRDGAPDRDVDEGRDGRGRHEHLVVDAQVHQDPVQVDLLLVSSPELRRGLHAGDGQHRHVVQLGVVQPVDEVQSARPRRGHAHAELPRRLGIAGGHEGRRFLVVDQEEADPILVAPEPLHDPVDAVAGEPEHGVHPPVDQPLHHQFGCDLRHRAHPSCLRRQNAAPAASAVTPASFTNVLRGRPLAPSGRSSV